MNNSIVKLFLTFIVSYIFTYFSSLLLLRKASKLVSKIKPELQGFHSKKEDIPNIGGISFVVSTALTSLIFAQKNLQLFYIIFLMISFGVLGFIDDYYKKDSDNGDGLKSLTKLFWQFLLAAFFIVFGTSKGLISSGFSFFVANTLSVKILENLILIFLLVYFVNAFNITDGLDGLLGFVSLPLCIVLIVVSLFFQDTKTVLIVLMSLTSALVAFLKFNKHPAKYFMGDCGSMALGSSLVVIALMMKSPTVFIIASLILSIELLTSFIQILSIRIFKKKVFSIAPLHHMYEKKGQSETSIVAVFFKVSVLFSIIALLLFYYWYTF